MPLRNLAWLLVVPGFVLLGLAICYSAPAPDRDYKLLRQVVDVLAEIDANYVKELNDEDREKLVEAMINGGLRELDPHSEYLNAEKRKQFETDAEGRIFSGGGVGITLATDPATKLLKVDHPMPETPAYDAGIIANDLIVRVGETPTEGMTTTDAAKLIKGPVGTQVTLTIRRAGRTPTDQDVTLTRAAIEAHPVIGVHRRTDDPVHWEWFADPARKIALIRIQTFSELTAGTKERPGELPRAIEEIKAAGGKAIILDLRENPGGLLNQAAAVVELFVPAGNPERKIVSTRDRRGSERTFYTKKKEIDVSTEEGRQKELHSPTFFPLPGDPRPMVVLVNKGSASASEIVAAALQDHGRAVVMGERTYGKGSVQKLFNLSGGAAVKLTTETYWRPSGKNIDRPRAPKDHPDEWGVKPNDGREVPTTDEERFRYSLEMEKLRWAAGRPDVVGPNPPPPNPLPIPTGADGKPLIDASKPYEDRPLARAVEYLTKQLSGAGRIAPLPLVLPGRVEA
jgi:carboxyl-terminal processing protease